MSLFVLLPPGNKIKLLSTYETIQLADVIKNGRDLVQSFKILEEKWEQSNQGVYDIDLISIVAAPLSQYNYFNSGREYAEKVQLQRRLVQYKNLKLKEKRKQQTSKLRRKQKEKKKEEILVKQHGNEELMDEIVQQDETQIECAQTTQDWENFFKEMGKDYKEM